MARAATIKVEPAVLAWAIEESGIDHRQLARRLEIEDAELESWLVGARMPTISALKSLATELHRPVAALLLPSPPPIDPPSIEFRRAPGTQRSTLTPTERLKIREARSVQEFVAWIVTETNSPIPQVPTATIDDSPARAAIRIRDALEVDVTTQCSWASDSKALDSWRQRIEGLGVLVFLMSLGESGARGFSLFDDVAPLIVINTGFNPAARVFTLFHELGHLVTRSDSICTSSTRTPTAIERWCESFAAEALMPTTAVEGFLNEIRFDNGNAGLKEASKLARTFHVSVRAAAIKLIDIGRANPRLYGRVPTKTDAKPTAHGGGAGARRPELRLKEFGSRAVKTVLSGIASRKISDHEAMRYLDVSFDNLQEMSEILST